jgi:predicted RNase H-like HicB family nuclease
MKCLSMTQPWAFLLATGHKQIETRSWSTQYRGPLLIHAAKTFPKEAQRYCRDNAWLFKQWNDWPWHHWQLPLGSIVGICELTDVWRITADNTPSPPEYHFGNYEPGRYGWTVQSVVLLPRPIPARGRLSLWEWDGEGSGGAATFSQDEDGVWVAEYPTIQGCVSQGQTKKEAAGNLALALYECLKARKENKQP